MFPLEVPKKPIYFISILIPFQSNIFNMTVIVLYSVACHMICLMPAEKAAALQLGSSLKIASLGYMDRIKFANQIMKDCGRYKFYKRCCYNSFQFKNRLILYFNYINDLVM